MRGKSLKDREAGASRTGRGKGGERRETTERRGEVKAGRTAVFSVQISCITLSERFRSPA
jgi:hypothetical protein